MRLRKRMAERSYRKQVEAEFKLSDEQRSHAWPKGRFARVLQATKSPVTPVNQRADSGQTPSGLSAPGASGKDG